MQFLQLSLCLQLGHFCYKEILSWKTSFKSQEQWFAILYVYLLICCTVVCLISTTILPSIELLYLSLALNCCIAAYNTKLLYLIIASFPGPAQLSVTCLGMRLAFLRMCYFWSRKKGNLKICWMTDKIGICVLSGGAPTPLAHRCSSCEKFTHT